MWAGDRSVPEEGQVLSSTGSGIWGVGPGAWTLGWTHPDHLTAGTSETEAGLLCCPRNKSLEVVPTHSAAKLSSHVLPPSNLDWLIVLEAGAGVGWAGPVLTTKSCLEPRWSCPLGSCSELSSLGKTCTPSFTASDGPVLCTLLPVHLVPVPYYESCAWYGTSTCQVLRTRQ